MPQDDFLVHTTKAPKVNVAQRDEASKDIPPLPMYPDAEGHGHEKASWRPIISLVLFLLMLLAIGIIGILFVSPILGILFCALGIALTVGVIVISDQYVNQYLKARRSGILMSAEEEALRSGEGEAAEEAKRVQMVGGILGRSGSGVMKVFSAALLKGEAEVVETNRAAEADATYAWATSVPAPEQVECTSSDGLRLVGHALACAPETHKWVLLAHDYAGHWTDDMLYARHYAEAGYNLLMVEMRGHGSSEGDYVGLGWPDRLDVVAWARWLVERDGADATIVLHGVSMGASAALLAAAEKDLPSQVKAVVSDCAYTDVLNVLRRLAEDGIHMPPHPLNDVIRLDLMLRHGGYDLAKAAPVNAVPASKAPIIFFHGEQDVAVAPYMAGLLHEAAGGAASGEGSRLVMFPHAGHGQSALSDPDRYYDELFAFVNPLVGDPAPARRLAADEADAGE